ncbi:MAG: hypothetical protein K2L46_05055 [Paramuribaculum sp.]|nr:hypothetical protein [Paramuribaculum sp.]MDE6488629.1 hypothetical protein [Paramuribaculum sp.]
MASKRDIKKRIHFVCGELAMNCIFAIDFIDSIDREKMDDIIMEIASLQRNSIKRLSFSFDRNASDFASGAEYRKSLNEYKKLAIKSLSNEFNQKIAEIVKKMNSLLSAEQREINKQAIKQ